jgi:membrane protein
MTKLQTISRLLKDTWHQWRADDAATLAAALAFYTALSIAPLLMAIITLVGAIFGQDTAERQLIAQIAQLMGPQAAAFAQLVIDNQPARAAQSGLFAVLELAVLFWGSANVFNQLLNTLNKIWNVRPKPGLGLLQVLRSRLFSFGLVLAIGFLLLVSLVLSVTFSRLLQEIDARVPAAPWLWQGANLLVTLAIATLLFALLFKYVPDVKIGWRVTWIGAAVTATLFVLGTFILETYLAGQGTSYGVAGSLIVFLLWVFYSAQILFLGAELTQVVAHHLSTRIEPLNDAELVEG